VFSEALVNRNRIAVLKMLDDHIKQSSISCRVQLYCDPSTLPQACRITSLTFGRVVECEWSKIHVIDFGKTCRVFYTTGDCLACDAPEHEAPDLLAPLTGDNCDTYFVQQPTTPDEVEELAVRSKSVASPHSNIIRRLLSNSASPD
jgi:hypothetical protein